MPERDAIVDVISSLTSLPEAEAAVGGGQMMVQFANNRSATLDLSSERGRVWSEVLSSMSQTGQPVYVSVDPASSAVSNVLIPLLVTVERITMTPEGDALVDLHISQARHYVRRSRSDFEEILNTLRSAQRSNATVAVTETEVTHEIFDVRIIPVPTPASADTLAPAEAEPRLSPTADVTLNQARQMFDLVKGRFCCPVSPAAPCITFNYPDDGCWARAHEMARLMIGSGVTPDKVWIYGRLQVPTQNNPRCQVQWGWHVAPTLRVSGQIYVIDPSLFPEPVTQATWKGVQGDPAAQLVPTSAAVFHRRFNGGVTYDPDYSQTNATLNNYRNALRLRSVSSDGPPPYVNCIPAGPGVQFRGVVAGGATQRWFTFNWPAAWHVVWTVMPLTICPGAPQISCTTQVERASATNVTYWITVRNLTSSAVKFEARYDVLKR